jgi:O-succinylhomoserine sulfhydrylase
MGMTDGVLRLSVGLEHPDDLIADLSFGLAQIND